MDRRDFLVGCFALTLVWAGCGDPGGPYTAQEIGLESASESLMRNQSGGGGGSAGGKCKITDTTDDTVVLSDGVITTAGDNKWCCNQAKTDCYACDNYDTIYHCQEYFKRPVLVPPPLKMSLPLGR